MISYQLKKYENGLTLIYHHDPNTSLVVSNLLYNVGARDENPEQTGFAHLFEHLMFGGSVNIPSFDTPLQKACGENNAFTSNDITNYYITLPAYNLETAMWLESDRMLQLDFSEKSLAVQKGVVVEEFKQRYLNQPYGDVWLHLRPLVYREHPYRWPTIGKEVSHIENARLTDVMHFFKEFYNPSNAVLCIGGNIEFDEADIQCQKWFGDIPAGKVNLNQYPVEHYRTERVEKTVTAAVPQNALYMAFLMPERIHPDYYSLDLLSDILSGSESGRLIKALVRERKLFTHIHAYITGDLDKGMFVVEGRLHQGVEFEEAEEGVCKVLNEIAETGPTDNELLKVKNKAITSNLFGKTSVLNKAMSLCYGYRAGDIELVNKEADLIDMVSHESMKNACKQYLCKGNQSVLKYKAK